MPRYRSVALSSSDYIPLEALYRRRADAVRPRFAGIPSYNRKCRSGQPSFRAGITPPSFRHAAAVLVVSSGDVNVVRSWLGRTRLDQQVFYAQANLDAKSAALERVDRAATALETGATV
jgi:hypothetical protein